jgi:hypothetical protein
MRLKPNKFVIFALLAFCLLSSGCRKDDEKSRILNVPKGYMSVIEIEMKDRLMSFGPFVGYYFKPETPDNFNRVQFVCFNERSFYTKDVPENSKLFEGDAVLTRLADVSFEVPKTDRINPIFFKDAPQKWLESRPGPKNEYVHFHSCYDSQGPVLTGYWIRHKGTAEFIYDMGGRVGHKSPLYHQVTPGVDKDFPRIMEFDRGPKTLK